MDVLASSLATLILTAVPLLITTWKLAVPLNLPEAKSPLVTLTVPAKKPNLVAKGFEEADVMANSALLTKAFALLLTSSCN